jgi:type VI secretion system protein ImpG
MNREFLDLYNRELHILHEQGREFAGQYPEIAERLGGLLGDQMDPTVQGLLEGAAFLAARVQLKLKHEFPEFTANLLDQLVPQYLAPIPSVILAQAVPAFGDSGLKSGKRFGRGAILDAQYREKDSRISCRFRLTDTLSIWPLEVVEAAYIPNVAGLQALKVPTTPNALAGLCVTFEMRTTSRREEEPPHEQCVKSPDLQAASCRLDDLTIFLGGADADAGAIYEQMFGHCVGVTVRWLDSFGDAQTSQASTSDIEQVGFGEDASLFPIDDRIFSGFDLLRDYFVFPRKFLAFRLNNLRRHMAKVKARRFDVVFAFDELNTRLSATVSPASFLLHAAPAINLFEKTTDRIPLRENEHEHHIVADRTRTLDFEPHRVLEVIAHHRGGKGSTTAIPLYGVESGAMLREAAIAYTVRRAPRRYTLNEQRHGSFPTYAGCDMFISLGETLASAQKMGVAELSVRALCSNRHLPAQLPFDHTGADLRFVDDSQVEVACVFGPTPPRDSVVSQLRSRSQTAFAGAVAWRLINMLALNHRGLVESVEGAAARALRDTLSMFADLSDSATERRIRGVRDVKAAPVVRRVRQKLGVGAARGYEVTVTLDERAFEGSSAFLLGAVLERFYREYAAANHFTQTIVRATERGEIMRWPVRMGERRPL